MARVSEPSISVRLAWPFARLAGSTESILGFLAGTTASFADPDARMPRSVAMDMVAAEAARSPSVGLRAAELTEAHDFHVLEYAARSAPTLGEAVHCMERYWRLMDDGADIELEAHGDRAVWQLRLKAGLTQPPAANDFAIATALAFSRRNVAVYEAPVEVHLAHDEPPYAAEYERVFGAPVRFGAPCNAIVIRRERLKVPMLRANPSIARAFEEHAKRLLGELRKNEGVSGSVRRVLVDQLRRGPITMASIAQHQAMAVATLRRRLREEGTTFEALLEEVRRDLALEYLRDPSLTLTEIAFLLGYGNVTSFTRAFQRWTGHTPTSHRERSQAEEGQSANAR
jgi:AraC-like DNA-binding protein